MAVDINWPALTTGADGKRYAETLCGFFHDKFQQIAFPKFLRSVSVVAFDLGTVPPQIEIQDITDPYPEFYEDAYAEGDDEDGDEFNGEHYNSPEEMLKRSRERRRRERREGTTDFDGPYHDVGASAPPAISHTPIMTPMGLQPPPYIDHRYPGFRPGFSPAVDQFTSPTFRNPASNLHYFHSALSSGFSGALTPLASLQQASADTFPNQSPLHSRSRRPPQPHSPSGPSSASPSQSPPSTGDSSKIPPPLSAQANPRLTISDDTHHTDGTREPPPTPFSDISISTHQQQHQSPLDSPSPPPDHHTPRLRLREPRDSDLQVIARVRYTGDVRMELTAELLLDYPAPSFVSLPVRLTITGMTFDGTAVVAHIGKRAHFCFVDNDPENRGDGVASMLKEIRIDSEIGEKGKGKQVLKNVGKVKDFVLDRVRTILEDEFVFPSSWTFLL
ncbi:hypothetical protein ABW19_dt0201487 [Dactylella cylindrospora]|nr:hypothetical protein ABW19_dt0201487 [Dactylella cylindrospora]